MAMPRGTKVRLIKEATTCYGTFPIGTKFTHTGTVPGSMNDQLWQFVSELGVLLLLSPKSVHEFLVLDDGTTSQYKPPAPSDERVIRFKKRRK